VTTALPRHQQFQPAPQHQRRRQDRGGLSIWPGGFPIDGGVAGAARRPAGQL